MNIVTSEIKEFITYSQRNLPCVSNLQCPEGVICVNGYQQIDFGDIVIKVQARYPVLTRESVIKLLDYEFRRNF